MNLKRILYSTAAAIGIAALAAGIPAPAKAQQAATVANTAMATYAPSLIFIVPLLSSLGTAAWMGRQDHTARSASGEACGTLTRRWIVGDIKPLLSRPRGAPGPAGAPSAGDRPQLSPARTHRECSDEPRSRVSRCSAFTDTSHRHRHAPARARPMLQRG